MPDVLVVHRQLTENLFLVRLQLCQEFLELCFVEDFTGSEGCTTSMIGTMATSDVGVKSRKGS